MPKYPIDLILFDLDGTLTDSIPPAITSIQAMLNDEGFPLKDRKLIASYVGFGEKYLVSESIGSKDEKDIARATKSYYKHYSNEGIQLVKLYPHVKDLLEKVKNKILIIISNKRDEFIVKIVENLGINSYFREIYGGDSSPCLKPEPCLVLSLLEKYDVPANRALFVGDMTIDIHTAKNSGIHACAVTYGFDSKEKLAAEKPDFMVDDIMKITDFIE